MTRLWRSKRLSLSRSCLVGLLISHLLRLSCLGTRRLSFSRPCSLTESSCPGVTELLVSMSLGRKLLQTWVAFPQLTQMTGLQGLRVLTMSKIAGPRKSRCPSWIGERLCSQGETRQWVRQRALPLSAGLRTGTRILAGRSLGHRLSMASRSMLSMLSPRVSWLVCWQVAALRGILLPQWKSSLGGHNAWWPEGDSVNKACMGKPLGATGTEVHEDLCCMTHVCGWDVPSCIFQAGEQST